MARRRHTQPKPTPLLKATHTPGNTESQTPGIVEARMDRLKLKWSTLRTQRFSGASTEWQSWEQFERAVHENDTLSDSEKFLYLRSSLSGKAELAIDGIQVTGANYNTAIELLKERFGRRDVLKQEHLTQLLELPPVRNENEAIGLRRLYDHLQRNIAALAALGAKTDGYGALLSTLANAAIGTSSQLPQGALR
ncbi:hypothetical protein HPB52_005173 [Rhipicephalus sanguineus]|uniref:Uncharacterized protein n=1 Tax=Rhipicephalus sanguineus TaxID=34632 RepID=A0A9D4SU04_RHISA|nr:hypothetical protein HPB52_005173 [Rhipicephalus sanguineus]